MKALLLAAAALSATVSTSASRAPECKPPGRYVFVEKTTFDHGVQYLYLDTERGRLCSTILGTDGALPPTVACWAEAPE
jgi:hypothetical protein